MGTKKFLSCKKIRNISVVINTILLPSGISRQWTGGAWGPRVAIVFVFPIFYFFIFIWNFLSFKLWLNFKNLCGSNKTNFWDKLVFCMSSVWNLWYMLEQISTHGMGSQVLSLNGLAPRGSPRGAVCGRDCLDSPLHTDVEESKIQDMQNKKL